MSDGGKASGDDPPQTADVESVVANGDIDFVAFGRTDAHLDLGRQICQRPVGAWDLDVVALGSLGGVRQLFESVSTVDQGSVNENEVLSDAEIDHATWYLIKLGAGRTSSLIQASHDRDSTGVS